MNKQQKHKAALRVACRVIGLAKMDVVCGNSRQPEAKATRALFYALCRNYWAKGAPASQADISIALGRSASNSYRVSQLVSGEPGIATTAVADAWHAAMRGEKVKVKNETVVEAVREVAGELADELV